MKGSFKFTQKERIALPQDFRQVMKSGRRLTSKNFIYFLLENVNKFHRLGIVVKKEVGPATLRNRIKRCVREFFRLHKHQIRGSKDIIILVKKGNPPDGYGETEKELMRVLL